MRREIFSHHFFVLALIYLINPTLGIPEIGELLLKLKVARYLRAATCDLVRDETLDRVPQLNEKIAKKKSSRDVLSN